jgi:hypothetical protein
MEDAGNPFKIHGVVRSDYFTDRISEIRKMTAVLREPGAKILVYGARRMGKTSTLMRAIERVNRSRGHAFLADLSTASTPIDMGNRILRSATRALGRRWQDLPNALLQALGASVKLTIDPATSLPTATFETRLRSASLSEQRKGLMEALDSINTLAGEKGSNIGIVLDEFQEIHRFGGTEAEWQLRGVIQNHHHLSYVLAGSKTHLIGRMIGREGAFYGMLDHMNFGPIDEAHLARWINRRITAEGIEAKGVGERCTAVAGPRTRDIVQLARRCFDLTRTRGEAGPEDVDRAFVEVAEESAAMFTSEWERLTRHQQNVLRAVAGGDSGLTTRRVRERFALSESGTASNAARSLMEAGKLLKSSDHPTGYAFDSPFFRGWIIRRTEDDLGLP